MRVALPEALHARPASLLVRLASSLDPLRLRRAFAVFVILVGLFLLGKNAFPG